MSLNQPASTATQPPLAVVGLSALFPKAENLDQFWSNIRRGVDAITEVPDTHWNPDDYFDANQKTPDMTYARRGGFLSPVPFDPLEYGITPNNLEAIDTSQLLGLVGAKRALEHAGYGAGRQFDRSRIGCILGVTGTLEMVIPLGARLGHPRWRKALKDAGIPDEVAEDVVQRISESYVPWQENSFPGLLGNVVAGRIANRLDLHGTNCVVDAACASSLSAIHLAALELWTGRSDMVVTGGIDTFNDIFMFMCFSKTPALSPTGDSKPFSETADGTILGEGVGMLVLKRLADAERDGDKIYAVLKGIGTSSDGAGNAVYAPKAEGQVRCLQDAYRVAGVSPSTVELVEAHGTGTKVGDATEVTGLMQVYKASGRRGPWCATGSIKSQIGHTKAAAGAAGVIKAILALQHKVLPPTIKVNQPPAPLLADDSPFYVNTEARPWVKPMGYPRRAAVSAFGFGGSNFHCVLEESPQNIDAIDWDGDVQIVALSATNQSQLSSQLQTWSQPAEWAAIRARATASRASFQASHAHRLLFVVERDKTDIAKLVSGAVTMLDKYADRAGWSTPDGAYYGRGAAAGRLGVLFPGQGSQYLGMLRELACRFPVMNDVLSEANEVFASRVESGPARALNRLTDFVYPPPSWTQADRDRCDNELRATQVAQPAIGAVSLGALAILEQFGVQPEAAAGHSYGELTALCASRRFAPKTLYRLSMLRGRLMAEAQEVDGGMLAVGAPLTQVEAAIKEMAVDLVVANYNSPNQIVLSGRIPEIDRATALFSQRNLRGKKLQVAAAFHSPLVATASRAFRPELEVVDFAPSQMPVYANSTGSEYPADPAAARDLLASQLARPVNFVSEIEQMYADGVRTFLEVGPGGVLTGLVNSILSGREFRAVALDSSNGRRGGVFDLAHALAQLAASGHAVRLDVWDPQSQAASEGTQSNRLRIPICGANYVKPRNPLPPRAPMVVPTTMPVADVPAANGRLEAVSLPSAQQPLAPASVIAPASILASPPAMNPTNMPEPQPPSLNTEAINTIQLHLQTLKQMQEETARLHQQFLESQESALRTFEELSRRQLELTNGVSLSSLASSIRPTTTSAPAWLAQPLAPAPVAPVSAPFAVASSVAPAPRLPAAPTINSQPPAPSTQYSVLSTPIATATPVAPVPAPLAPAVAASATPSPPFVPAPAPMSVPVPTATVESPRINSELATTVLTVVSEKTGYPTEMLSLGMSLDHDLGIDSIKRVEILSALQERVANLPAFKPDELGSLHTLGDVVTLAEARSAGSSAPANAPAITPLPSSQAAPAAVSASLIAATANNSPVPVQSTQYSVLSTSTSVPAPTSPAGPSLSATVLAVVSEKTGYPTEMLNLGMSLDHDLGIDSIKRVEILSALQERVTNLPAFKPDELGSLHTLGDVVALAEARSTSSGVSAASVAVSQAVPSAVSNATVNSSQPSVPSTQYSVLSTATSAPAVTAPAGPSLSATVLEVVSEKTGYPTEMLNLGMSLDHDLGIDSIKRVEILSALQERVTNLPAFKPDELGSLHTLGDVVTLAEARSSLNGNASPASLPAASSVPAPAASNAQPAAPSTQYSVLSTVTSAPAVTAPAGPSLSATVLEVVSEKTGYPTEMLNLGMSLDHDLGIDSIKRVEILSALQERVTNLPAFKPEELGSLHTLGDVVTLAEARSSLNGNASPASLPAASSVPAPAASNAQPAAPSTQYSVLSTVTSAPAVTAPAGPSLSATVLEVVSEKTGYPTEMLNLGMSLDHDLGIDSIKRVEILSALQERVTNLPAFKPEELGSLHTLGDVVTLAEARSSVSGQTASATSALPVGCGTVAPATAHPSVLSNQYSVLSTPALGTNPTVQRPTAEISLSQPASLVRSVVRSAPLTPQPGLSIAAGSEVWVTEDGQGLSLQIATELSRRGLKGRLIQLDEPAAITLPERLAGLIVVAPADGTNDRHLWRAIELLQKAGPSLRQSAANGASVFVTISRLDGRFGFEAQQPLADPLSGGLAGLTKSAAREWPEVACKAIDVSGGWASLNEAAMQVVDQLLRKGPIEVGLSPQGVTTPTVIEESLSSFRSSAPIIQPGDLVIVSGGARGVTAEAAIVAAQKWNCRLAILGRSPAPPAEPEWLRTATTEAEIKQALIRNLPRGTLPKAIESQLRQILAGREITMTLQRLQGANIAAQYYAVDIRDLTAVRDLIVQLQAQFGPVRGIIHGAGVLADQRIEDKTRDQFDRVYQTKVTGLRNLLGAIRPDQLKALCLFSSYTARYGRIGQCDYAIANEVLNKLARQFSIEQRQCHVVSFNWGPWDGGMVTGGLKKLFAAEQVGLIPLADGADLVVQEFSQSSILPVEVLVLGKTDAPAAEPAPVIQQPVPTPAAPESSELKVAYEKTVDVSQFPFLESHVIGGKAVVPVAIILEWLAHGAIHHNPGLELEGFDDFRVFHGLRLDRNDKPLLRVIVGKATRVDGRFTIRTQLVSVGARETIHAAGNVILTARPTATPSPQLKIQPQAYSLDMTTAYATKLFHGQHLHGIAAVETCSPDGIVVASRTSPAPWAWMHEPFRNAWLADPLSIDCALQAVILWTQEQRGMPCLPCAIGSYRQFRKAFPTAGVRIAIKVTQATEHTVRADVEFLDGQGQLVAQMIGCESVADASLANAFRQNRLP